MGTERFRADRTREAYSDPASHTSVVVVNRCRTQNYCTVVRLEVRESNLHFLTRNSSYPHFRSFGIEVSNVILVFLCRPFRHIFLTALFGTLLACKFSAMSSPSVAAHESDSRLPLQRRGASSAPFRWQASFRAHARPRSVAAAPK